MFPPADATKAATPSEKAKPEKSTEEVVVSRYRQFCYRAVGQRLDRGEPDEILAERLKQAGLNVTPGMHRSVELLTTLFSVVTVFAVGLVLFLVVIHVADWYLYLLLVVGVTFAAVLGGFRFLLSTRITNRREKLDRELPFTLSELSVLASTGTSPIKLFRRMAQRDHDPAMTGEFRKIVYKTDVQGKDMITALAETAKESPSTSVRDSFWDIANLIHQGGNLDEYLRDRSEDVMRLKRLIQKEFIERLSTFLDMYVSLVLVGVLMIAVGAFLLNALGTTAVGLDSNELLLLLTFGLVPVAVVMTVVLISIAYAKAE
ncbi:MAG TPA: type II secretion system F family protein [Thermoplasmata archaeon]|nr:type II secretion system F family protein [Thermoplasmata archaeon]